VSKAYFDYKEFEQWAKRLSIAKEEFKDWLYEFLFRQGERVVALAKTRQQQFSYVTSEGKYKIGLIDTGNMLRSWTVSDVQVNGNDLYVEIYNPAEYASYIEYGQRSFKGAFILTVSIDEVQRQLPARFNKEWLQWLQSKGVM